MSTLEARQLSVIFRQRGAAPLRAVDDVSFTLRPGETLALVGESGSGKSTVVRALADLQRLTGGTILLDGEAVRHGRRALRAYRRQVQVVFQDPFASLNPAHSVAHHLARPLLIHGLVGRGGALETKVAELLESVTSSLRTRWPDAGRTSFLAASASEWPSPGPWLPNRRCCWPTSQCPCLTCRCDWRSSTFLLTWSVNAIWPCCT